MSPLLADVPRDAVAAVVIAAYEAAGLVPGTSAVAPLRRLVAAQPLVVDEVPALTRHGAATYLAARAGRPMVGGAAAAERLAGFLYANAAGGWVLVELSDPLVRRRFTVAHELGHYLLHFLPELERASARRDDAEVEFNEELLAMPDTPVDVAASAGRVTFSRTPGRAGVADSERLERDADRFAAEVLMPEGVCRTLAREYAARCGGKRQVLARRLATECLVSQTAMLRRLADLGLP